MGPGWDLCPNTEVGRASEGCPTSAWGIASLTTRPWSVQAWIELGHNIYAGTPAFATLRNVRDGPSPRKGLRI
jgi:hypothetical protein